MLKIKRLMKGKVLLLSLLVSVLSAKAQNSTYITNHKIMANLLSEHYGIPAPVILAVATVESSGGQGSTARVLKNHFGMEGKNDLQRYGKKSRYKKYNSELLSYIDFCEVISRKKFYNSLKNNNDTKAWVKAISHAGYSEEPQQWERKVYSVLAANKM